MVLSSRTISALKLLIDLGERYSTKEMVSLNDVAKRKDLSKKFLEQIIPLLRQADLLIGNRGNQGGYRLAKKPTEISLKDILYLTEPVFNKNESGSQAIDKAISGLDKAVEDYLSNKTLQDLIDEEIESYSNSYII